MYYIFVRSETLILSSHRISYKVYVGSKDCNNSIDIFSIQFDSTSLLHKTLRENDFSRWGGGWGSESPRL